MTVIRCTRKLLLRVGTKPTDGVRSTSRLGDWFVNLHSVGHLRLLLAVSEHSRLPVLLPARDVKNLGRLLPPAVERVLLALGCAREIVDREIAEMHQTSIAATNNRSILGTINDFGRSLPYYIEDRTSVDHLAISLRLSDTPIGNLDYKSPDALTRAILQ